MPGAQTFLFVAPVLITKVTSNPLNFLFVSTLLTRAKKGGRSPREKGPGLAVWGEKRFF